VIATVTAIKGSPLALRIAAGEETKMLMQSYIQN
jgi:hypothetical protein